MSGMRVDRWLTASGHINPSWRQPQAVESGTGGQPVSLRLRDDGGEEQWPVSSSGHSRWAVLCLEGGPQ